MSARFIIGDVRDALAKMPDGSVDLIFTSPPFLGLRSYLPADDPDKHREIGGESTPGAFIDTLLDLTEEWARVLTSYGSLVVELGDTYSGSGGAGGDYSDEGLRSEQPRFDGSARRTRASGPRTANESRLGVDARNRARRGGNVALSRGDAWPEAKSLCLIPESYRWALVYGRNPFTGRETPRWRARNVVRWCRPNPPVGALGDKFRPATSELVVACKSGKRWFDLDAVRTEPQRRFSNAWGQRGGDEKAVKYGDNYLSDEPTQFGNSAGVPPLDWWEIPTQPYAGSHYATFPERLCVRPIEAMCPREVCTECGEPRRRITETTIGWSDCGHGSYRRGVVLDPFVGSGTTLAVAEGLGRDSIGIDLDARNVDLALERCGMFLSVSHLHMTEGDDGE